MGARAAFILAGGKSSRMGSDKAFLPFGETTLLERALGLARSVVSEVWIVGDPSRFASYAPTIKDTFEECGPLAGIHAALCNSAADLNLILAVDLPFVQTQLLQYLFDDAHKSGVIVTVPRAGGRYQPLTAIYRREFLPVAEQALRNDKLRIDLLFPQVQTRIVEEEELLRNGFSPELFRNLNTPEDLARATQEYAATKPPRSH